LKNRFKSVFIEDFDEMISPKFPVVFGVVLIYLATVFVQSSGKLSFHETIGFTIVMLIQIVVFLFSNKIFKHKYWIYFIVQGIITFDYAIIAHEGYKTIVLGLVPLLIIQSMIVYNDAIKVILTSMFFYSIFGGTIIIINGFHELIQSLPLIIIITIAMRAYAIFYFKQVKLRIQTQKVLKELELAYEKVEELTLANERQRMARDLHDTLSQGLAGLIMQLEAINANLSKENVKRANEIVEKSMEHARRTLADSRLVINDLRSYEKRKMDLNKSLENEIDTFKNVSNAFISKDINIEAQISSRIIKQMVYIVREALNNIAKHAKAENVVVKIIEINNKININISDDGVGFDIRILDKLFGHYGIVGITERVKAINGEIKIESKRKVGTNINIIIPIEKGIDEENG